ncbi:MAG: RRXRR domain-containing protein [Ktedonobacteraceae bacterium]|nr:RRXRR domain-containing protein [Ktedonobacteraceae bacterium]
MSKVFVLDANRKPLNLVHPGRARVLLKEGKAAVLRSFPFTIILKAAVPEPAVVPLRLKLDPGAQTTGLALLDDASGEVLWAAEVSHRGFAVKAALDARLLVRRSRRSRKTRYRQPRFSNRRRKPGWLPPSLESRIANVLCWVARLRRLCPLEALSLELVKFDTQAMQQPEIEGIAYQQGELLGYEIRAYLLEKWGRACAYCGETSVPLQVEHIRPKAKGGTDSVSNLTLACQDCNQAKGHQDVCVFLANKPEMLVRILAQAKAPLRDAAVVNSSRWILYERLKTEGLPLETGSGGLTKFNRSRRNLPKTHWLDAANVGVSTPEYLKTREVVPLLIKATGHGSRQMCGTNASGFPIRLRSRHKVHHGYQTGDLVRAVVPVGKKAGTHVGRVLARASGSFDLVTTSGRITGINHRYCHPVHRNDGYAYTKGERHERAA